MPDFDRWTAGGGEPSINEINRADHFFEALAAKQRAYPTDAAEAELAFLLSGFRDDVRDTPVTAPVSASDAVAALQSGLASGHRPRRSLAIVGSVAAAVLCIGGFGTAVYGAAPGDSLYGIRSTLFGQGEATRDDQVSLASAQLQQVQQLIDQGQWQQAQEKLVAVSNTVQGVDDQVGDKQQLVEQWNALTYKVVEQDPAATLAPGAPLPVLPSSPLTWLPMPEVVTTTSTEPTETSDTSLPSDGSTTTDSPVPSGPEILLTTPGTSITTTTSGEEAPTTTNPPTTTTNPPTTTTNPPTTTTNPPTTTTNPPTTSTNPPTTTTNPPTTTTNPPATATRPPVTTTAIAAGSPAPAPTPTATATQPPSTRQAPSPPAEIPSPQPRLVPSPTPVEAPAPSAAPPSQVVTPSQAAPVQPAPTTTIVPPQPGSSR